MNQKLSDHRKAHSLIAAVSIAVFAFLIWFIYGKTPADSEGIGWVPLLPYFNAFLNFCTTVFLLLGYSAIKNGLKDRHKKLMISAMVSSAIFLVSYLLYHHYQGDTKFLGQGLVRYSYFFILITHILLSMVQVPLILITFYHAVRGNFITHRKWAVWTFPIWLYVSITGVIIFYYLKFLNS